MHSKHLSASGVSFRGTALDAGDLHADEALAVAVVTDIALAALLLPDLDLRVPALLEDVGLNGRARDVRRADLRRRRVLPVGNGQNMQFV